MFCELTESFNRLTSVTRQCNLDMKHYIKTFYFSSDYPCKEHLRKAFYAKKKRVRKKYIHMINKWLSQQDKPIRGLRAIQIGSNDI